MEAKKCLRPVKIYGLVSKLISRIYIRFVESEIISFFREENLTPRCTSAILEGVRKRFIRRFLKKSEKILTGGLKVFSVRNDLICISTDEVLTIRTIL